jgi:alpha-D-ribose 1-methylphosphonate 5-triphosphate synthase subunit PhnH
VRNLADIAPSFASPGADSQQVFRGALEALSRPGRVVQLSAAPAELPRALHAASGALALALLDPDTALWLSPRLRDAGAYLRFHTGCPIVAEPGAADFALLDCDELERLDVFRTGTDEYPDRSATLIVQVQDLGEVAGFTLSGPGVRAFARIAIGGLGERFLLQWARNRALFPRGVDLFLACRERLSGLPRTTRIDA